MDKGQGTKTKYERVINYIIGFDEFLNESRAEDFEVAVYRHGE